jgi:hypothetical protein
MKEITARKRHDGSFIIMLVWFVGSTSSTPNRPKTRAGRRVFGVWVWGLIDMFHGNDKARQKNA